MTYSILDTGNLVTSFRDEDAAWDAMDRLTESDPDATERLLMIVADDAGNMVADYAPGERVASAAEA